MNEGYYNTKGESVSKEVFDREKQLIIADRIKDTEDDNNFIAIEDLDYYSNELEKLWSK